MGSLKESKQALGAEVIAGLQDFAPPTLLAQASRLNFSTRLFNLIVTNVPGPQFPLYLLGREMERIVPIAFLPENHALAIAIMSYNGKVDFGLLARLRRDARPRGVRRLPRGVARRAAEGGPQEERLGGARQRLEEGHARQGLEGLEGARAGEGLTPATLLAPHEEASRRRRRAPGRAGRRPGRPAQSLRTRLRSPERRALLPDRDDTERVPSFDGVPMDVDVTLPPSGDGPFPAIVMMHGWGGNKRSFQATTPEGRRRLGLPLQQRLLRAAGLRGDHAERARLRPLVRRRRLAHVARPATAAGSISPTTATRSGTRSTSSGCWRTRA